MAEFLILPKAFVEYVTALKRIPVPPGAQLESLRSEIELVCLEAAMGGLEPEPPPGQCDPAPGSC